MKIKGSRENPWESPQPQRHLGEIWGRINTSREKIWKNHIQNSSRFLKITSIRNLWKNPETFTSYSSFGFRGFLAPKKWPSDSASIARGELLAAACARLPGWWWTGAGDVIQTADWCIFTREKIGGVARKINYKWEIFQQATFDRSYFCWVLISFT